MNLEQLEREYQRVLDLVATAKVGSDDYIQYLNALEDLQKQILTAKESAAKIENQERDMNLKEVQSKTDAQLKQQEIDVKKKESKRQTRRTLLVIVAGLIEVAGLAFFDEIKPMVGSAWKHIIDLRPRL